MTKRRLSIVLLAAGFVGAFGMAIIHMRHDPPLGYYLHWTWRSCPLPDKYIRRAFACMTDRAMPRVARNARAIWFGGREARIFVRFETDAEGIACIERAFNIPEAQCEIYDEAFVKRIAEFGASFFPHVTLWQEKSGVIVFDPHALGAGRRIRYVNGSWEGWEIYIDDEHRTVYVYAWPHT